MRRKAEKTCQNKHVQRPVKQSVKQPVKQSVKQSVRRRGKNINTPNFIDDLDQEQEIVDDGPDPDDPDEGKARDEFQFGPPAGRDALFDDDAVEKKNSTQRFRVDN